MGDKHICRALWIFAGILLYGCSEVRTVSPVRKNIVATVYASGEIVPKNERWLSSVRSGILLKKYVKEGDTVKTGQLLYVVGDEAGQAKVDAAFANHRLSALNLSDSSPILKNLRLTVIAATAKTINDSLNYWRWQNLWSQGIGTKSNLDNVYTQFCLSANDRSIAEQRYLATINELKVSKKIAESQLANAKKDFADGFIFSNQDGIIYETLKNEGEAVSVNDRLLMLGDCTDRTIKLYIDQQDIAKIKYGQKILVQTDQTASMVFEATVTFIYPSMNRNDQTFCIEAKFNRDPPYSFVHSPVEANIIIEERNDVLVIPKEVLAGRDSIWVKEDKKSKKVFVQTGITSFDYVEVISGVDEKTAVILDWYKLN